MLDTLVAFTDRYSGLLVSLETFLTLLVVLRLMATEVRLRKIEALQLKVVALVPTASAFLDTDGRTRGEAAIEELDRVSLLAEQTDRSGTRVPAGATGTVVAVLKGGQAYMVEFTKPVEAVVTVRAGCVAPAGGASA